VFPQEWPITIQKYSSLRTIRHQHLKALLARQFFNRSDGPRVKQIASTQPLLQADSVEQLARALWMFKVEFRCHFQTHNMHLDLVTVIKKLAKIV